MKVLSGRASCGARAALRTLFGGIFAAFGLIAGGCGSTTFTYGTPVITFSTVPGPFTAYVIEVDSIALTRSDNTVVYPLSIPEFIDFTKFNDVTELMGTPAVLEGSYVSATITVDYAPTQFPAQVFVDVNGVSTSATVYDGNASAASTTGLIGASTFTYTVKFDPANPLVIKNGVSTPLEFNFDLSASTVLDKNGTPAAVTFPVMTASTAPVTNKPLHARGVFVVGDPNGFTINSRAFFDTLATPVGAVEIQTDANTIYNVNGLLYTGAAGLAQISQLPINTLIEAYGSLGALDNIKPSFVATQVYAGSAVENLALSRVTGTVSARTATSLTVKGAELSQYVGGAVLSGDAVCFFDTMPVTVASNTVVNVDGQPNIANPSIDLISVGQRVSVVGLASASLLVGCTAGTTMDATGGLIRLTPSTAWGTLKAASAATSGTIDLTSLSDHEPGDFTFTGTGSATGADADPTAYVVNNTSSVDLTTIPANSLVRVDGTVTPFGSAPPDFAASAVTPGSATDQLLVVDWLAPGALTGGSTTPFVSVTSQGITVNMSDPNLGASHFIQTGPVTIPTSVNTIDLTSPLVNPKIVPDPNITGQFTVGNASATGYSLFNSYASFLTQMNTVLNGTNKILKLVAVGKWDGAGTFTAYRIDIVQYP